MIIKNFLSDIGLCYTDWSNLEPWVCQMKQSYETDNDTPEIYRGYHKYTMSTKNILV